MTTTTATFEPIDLIYYIPFPNGMPDPQPVIEVTGPVDGVWTVSSSDESITQDLLDAGIASLARNNMIAQNMQELFDKVAAALPGNRDFLAIPSPTIEETDAQIKALTRQINALLILRTGVFDDISGT
jgi:hypothetical protein